MPILIALAPTDPSVPIVAWAARALTFFNVLVLLWLGLTILLTAERRRLGTWLTGGGLLLGGICSITRASAQAAQPITVMAPLDVWWRASWLPFAGASYLWSVVLTWYAGHLRTRAEWRSFVGLSVLGAGVFLLLLMARPPDIAPPLPQSVLPSTTFSLLAFETAPGDAYLALGTYLTFTALCVGAGLHALYSPGSPDRFMGELASQRARPWLTATSLVTLGLSLVVGFGVTGVTVVTPLVLVDLLGAMLLAAQVVLLGQAIVSYEVFTGKTLPRRGLARYWRNALILAAGFGGLMAISLGLPLDQSYRLLLALVIVAIFYALLSWRSFVERERSLDQLRPFVASERLVDHLLTLAPAPTPGEALTPRPRHGANIGCADVPLPALTNDGAPPLRGIPVSGEGAPVGAGLAPPAPSPAPPAVSSVSPATPPASRVPAPLSRAPGTVEGLGVRAGASDPFIALCERLLGARVAFLCPAGPLASLVGAPLAIPSTASPPSSAALADLVARIGSARQLCLPIEPSTHGDATWVVPLWGERSLIGLLLLGDRHDGSLYAQEEIEIARAAGERLIDARAAGELARRLLLLQRRRLAEDQILDGRVRRALHDDVLPLLHTALLTLNSRRHDQPPSADTPPTEAAALLADAHRQISELLASLPPALAPDVARLGLVGALRRVVDDLGSEIDGVQWRIDPDGEVAAAALSPLAAEVLFGAAREAIRNAARHARSDDRSRLLHLGIVVASHDDELTLQIQDDGVGLAASADTQSDGLGGQGLMLHGTLLTVLGGTLAVDSTHGNGTRVTLRVPSPG